MDNPSQGQPELEVLDIEAFTKEHPGHVKPHARGYVIRVDRETKTVNVPSMKGRQILALVGKTPETHKLFQKHHGSQPEVVGPDDTVSFTKPGIERFQTIPKDTTDGESRG